MQCKEVRKQANYNITFIIDNRPKFNFRDDDFDHHLIFWHPFTYQSENIASECIDSEHFLIQIFQPVTYL